MDESYDYQPESHPRPQPQSQGQFQAPPTRPAPRWPWLILAGLAPALIQASFGFYFILEKSGVASKPVMRGFDNALSFALLLQPIYVFAWSLFLFRGSSLPTGWRIFWSFPIAFAMSIVNIILGIMGCAAVAGM